MNSTLRKLRRAKLSANQMANLFQKHIADGTNQRHCQDACDAVLQGQNEGVKNFIRCIKILIHPENSTEDDWCAIAQQTMSWLRNSVDEDK
jgi:hypothetical protein